MKGGVGLPHSALLLLGLASPTLSCYIAVRMTYKIPAWPDFWPNTPDQRSAAAIGDALLERLRQDTPSSVKLEVASTPSRHLYDVDDAVQRDCIRRIHLKTLRLSRDVAPSALMRLRSVIEEEDRLSREEAARSARVASSRSITLSRMIPKPQH